MFVWAHLLVVVPLFLMGRSVSGMEYNCPTPPSPRNGNIKETRNSQGNKMLYFTCDPGYILVGEEVLTCWGNSWNGSIPQCLVTHCKTHYMSGARVDGVYEVIPDGHNRIKVLCDMTTAGGGWTVFQQRLNNFTSFNRDWEDYKKGFGDDKGNLWLGLETLHHLTWNNSELYVEMDGDRGVKYAQNSMFVVGGEWDQYRLTVDGHSGTVGDSLTYHSGQKFSTCDRDNDINGESCAKHYSGAWWYKNCFYSNLNGLYLNGTFSGNIRGMSWHQYKYTNMYSLTRSKMMMR